LTFQRGRNLPLGRSIEKGEDGRMGGQERKESQDEPFKEQHGIADVTISGCGDVGVARAAD
jgi:hypothetical protein